MKRSPDGWVRKSEDRSKMFRNVTNSLSSNEGHVKDDCSDSAANATDGKYCR